MRWRRPSPWFAAAVVLVLAAALVVRLDYMSRTAAYEVASDARDYDVHARSIAAGEGFSDRRAHGRPTAFRPPGYPYFLGGVYWLAGVKDAEVSERIHAARVSQAIVGTVLVALLGLLAAQLAGPLVGLVAMGLAAVYVPLITVGGAVMSEPLFVVFMLGALIAAIQHRRSPHRRRWVVLAGVLAGLAIITRANAVVLLLPLALAVWEGRPRFSRAALAAPALVCVLALLMVVPWTVRNAQELDTFIPVSTQLGSALAGTYNDSARTDDQNPASWRHIKHIPEFADLWRNVRNIPEPELERELRARSLDYITDHPTYVAEVGFWNTVRVLDLAGFDRARGTAAWIGIEPDWADRGVVCFWIFAALAAAGGLTASARRTPAFIWAVPLLMFLSVVFLVVETPRYRTAIDPFVVILAAMAVTALGLRAAESFRSWPGLRSRRAPRQLVRAGRSGR